MDQRTYTTGSELEKAKIERTAWEQHRKECCSQEELKKENLGDYLGKLFHCPPEEARQRSTLLHEGLCRTQEIWGLVNEGKLSLSDACARARKLRNGKPSNEDKPTSSRESSTASGGETPVASTPPTHRPERVPSPALEFSPIENVIEREAKPSQKSLKREAKPSQKSLDRELAELRRGVAQQRVEQDKRILELDQRIDASCVVSHLPAPMTTELIQPLTTLLHQNIYKFLEEHDYLRGNHVLLSRLIQDLLRGINTELRTFSGRLESLRDTDTSPLVSSRGSVHKALLTLQFEGKARPSFGEVKTRYRDLARKAHPDVTHQENDYIRALNRAYAKLTRYYERTNHAT